MEKVAELAEVEGAVKVKYIKGAVLNWPNLWEDLGLEKDKGGRWWAGYAALDFVREYCKGFRTPSRAWPYSHAKPLLTQKFAKHLVEKDPTLAIKLGVAVEI